MALLRLVPVWSVRYLPALDGPSHLYNSSILLRLLTGDHGRMSEFFQIDWRPNPNWIGHAVMAMLMTAIPPLVAEKLVVTAIIAAFLYGSWRFAASPALAFLGLLLVDQQSLQFGFYNYSFAVGLYMIIVALWWNWRDRTDVCTIVCTSALLILLYFSHPLPLAAAMLSIGVLWLFSRKHVLHLIPLIPVTALMLWYRSTQPAMSSPPPAEKLISYITHAKFLLTFDLRQETFGLALFILYLVLIVATLWIERKRALNPYAVIFATLAILYFIAPAVAAGGIGVNDRIALFLYLVPLAWFTPRLPKIAQTALVAIVSIAAIGNVAFLTMHYRRASHDIADIVRTFDGAEADRTFVPLLFDPRPARSVLGLLAHSADYAALDHKLIDLTNYEPEVGYFPIRYRPGIVPFNGAAIATAPQDFDVNGNADRVDYVFTWKMPPGIPFEAKLNERYALVQAWSAGRLYRRR